MRYEIRDINSNFNFFSCFRSYIFTCYKITKIKSIKISKNATEIYDHLKAISTRFSSHFDNIYKLRKKLEEAMTVVDSFGKDARSITRTLENIKDPEQVEKAVKTENVEKFIDHSKQLKN